MTKKFPHSHLVAAAATEPLTAAGGSSTLRSRWQDVQRALGGGDGTRRRRGSGTGGL